MALSTALHLRQNLTLALTPQLMQSIRLLQLTHVELARFIEEEIERNPLLEPARSEADDGMESGLENPGDGIVDGRAEEWPAWSGNDGESLSERLGSAYENVYQDDLKTEKANAPDLASQWKSMPARPAGGGDDFDLDMLTARAESLRDHVGEQIAFAGFTPGERAVAIDLADHLDEAGYLRCEPADAAARLGCPVEKVESVLRRLQAFDPPGLFARDLAECLALQLGQQNRLDPAMRALLDHLDLLARRDFVALRRICGVGEDDLVDMLAEIRALDPKPGHRFDAASVIGVVADVLVTRSQDGGWALELNPETLPKVLVNRDYYAEVSRHPGCNPAERAFLADCLQSASWLTRSLDQRARTILKVAGEIVRRQDQFLMKGVDHLRPLNLKAVADAIGMHESTVSRVTSNKYMLTPRGVFELKYFFTVPIASAKGGDAHSAESVRHRIKALITAEEADAVLSDDAIVDILRRSGVDIARRTVAKYRESMNIPSSVQRRREKRALARSEAF